MNIQSSISQLLGWLGSPIISHAGTFIAGVIVGAAGNYLAEHLTDKRHRREQLREASQAFRRIEEMMPDLLDAMRTDLALPDCSLIREFVVLPNNRVIFNHDEPRFEYYEDQIPNLVGKVKILEDRGYVRDATISNTPIYRMSEEFVSRLQNRK